MNDKNNSPWYKKWWVWVIAVLVISSAVYASNPDAATQNAAQPAAAPAPTETPEPKKWTKVAELTGESEQKSGDVFKVTGSTLRVKYTVNATSDSGTALLYVLPEGSTITKNSKGELDVAVQDVSTIGSKTGEQIIRKQAGNYYLFINTSSVKDYKITVEEQK